MSSLSAEGHKSRPVDTIAGLLAAAACALAILAIAQRPIRYSAVAVIISLVAARMSPRWQNLALAALGLAMVGWMLGMTLAVTTKNPLF